MRSVIQQIVVLPATAERLFEMYLDPAAHGAITGSEVIIGYERGSVFRAFDGALSGAMLAIVKPMLIVQSWRSSEFEAKDPDSTLILTFSPNGEHGQIDLVHLDVPEHDYKGVTDGWGKYYWTPWKGYLDGLRSTGPRPT